MRSREHGFTKGKSWMANMITSYNELTGLVDEAPLSGSYCLPRLQQWMMPT